MRMQSKLTLVCICIALVSSTLTGAVAYYLVKRDVGRASADQAFQAFQVDFTSYVRTYGSVKTALETEGFDAFVRRAHKLRDPVKIKKLDNPPLTNRWRNPPFHLLVLDADGVVLFPANGFKIGENVPRQIVEQCMDIAVDGKVIARALRLNDAVFTEQDEQLLHAVKQSLFYGVLVAVSVSVFLCLIFGRILSTTMRNLNHAIERMRTRREKVYQVEVVSDDELGQLAESFNLMNAELAAVQIELREQAIRDPLTNLYNRRHFEEQARHAYESASRYGHPLSMMIGDLDHFRRINDEFSREIGDLVLEKVAEIITNTTRKSDVVSRYGGEELVVLFANTDREQAAVSCMNIKQAIESYPWEAFAPNLAVTMSMGLCENTGLASAEAMLSLAGRFLSAAKKSGRNKLVFG
eukprot:TRINITY_DN13191_c0_g1_i1.p1 TRINITY_DN13191_c0_g1~~TRINITY_DN13191_c0_g1_i1.p1  ORF type:complete len:410 (-),score=60.88 TRINITY_DN13191_c0_g1_i1:173-1402(-)